MGIEVGQHEQIVLTGEIRNEEVLIAARLRHRISCR